MKKTTLILCGLLISATLFAQSTASTKSEKKSGATIPDKKNCVKLNLTSLAFRNIALQYERALGPKISVACQIRLMPKGSLPFTSALDNAVDSFNISAIKINSFAITPEFRYYVRKSMKGFYLAPYFRFRNMGMEAPLDFTNASNVKETILLTGKVNSFGGGLMIGSHFNIGKSFSLDWFILGFQYMASSGSLTATTTNTLSANDQAELSKQLNSNGDSKFFKYSYTVNSHGATVDTKFGLVGFRGFGLNFGYRF